MRRMLSSVHSQRALASNSFLYFSMAIFLLSSSSSILAGSNILLSFSIPTGTIDPWVVFLIGAAVVDVIFGIWVVVVNSGWLRLQDKSLTGSKCRNNTDLYHMKEEIYHCSDLAIFM